MDINIIWPGKTKDFYIHRLVLEYCKKIKKMIRFRLIEIKETKYDAVKRLREEKKLIEQNIPKDSYIIVLDVNGKRLNTMELANIMESLILLRNKHLVFIIGSHNGLHNDIKKRANLLLSLSALDLPHELSRVMLLEQIYRILCYFNKVPYAK